MLGYMIPALMTFVPSHPFMLQASLRSLPNGFGFVFGIGKEESCEEKVRNAAKQYAAQLKARVELEIAALPFPRCVCLCVSGGRELAGPGHTNPSTRCSMPGYLRSRAHNKVDYTPHLTDSRQYRSLHFTSTNAPLACTRLSFTCALERF